MFLSGYIECFFKLIKSRKVVKEKIYFKKMNKVNLNNIYKYVAKI